MTLRVTCLVGVLTIVAVPGWTQSLAQTPPQPLSVGVVGGLSAGSGDSGGSFGGTFAFDATDRLAVEARALRLDRGNGERGLELSGAMRFTLARTKRARPYVAVGGGVYRVTFDLGDPRFFGMMNGQYAGGTPFVPLQGMPGYAMMGAGVNYRGTMWQGAWSGPTFNAGQMPMFYRDRLGQMRVPNDGQWGARTFTDPALTFGGGLTIDLTDRLYLSPDVRGLVVFSSGDRMALTTMSVGFGVRF